MGKRTRKTRWRTLPIADESDSEESNTLSGSQLSKNYHHRPFYSKFTYSSQSTPTKRFPYEPKSTRSSSTASENKITFNEDEYTKITTPRQDVLFKKGYLNKPKNYQTQTSTGNSTASTGNSTGNGTPDHQSADGTEGTDLEYESQFVFPNAFVDQNGIYYINSYEHYPLLMYNPTICYPEYPISRTKRHSTGSLTESTSPHTEETSQDLSQSGGENTGNGPEFNHVYNVIYPGYYFNGVCNPNVTTNGQAATEPRKIKKKRRRKISKSVNQEGSTTSEDGYSSDEAITQVENRIHQTAKNTTISCNGSISTSETATCLRLDDKEIPEKQVEDTKPTSEEAPARHQDEIKDDKGTTDETQFPLENGDDKDIKAVEENVASKELCKNDVVEEVANQIDDNSTTQETPTKDTQELDNVASQVIVEEVQSVENATPNSNDVDHTISNTAESSTKESKFNLNAEEFVPRAYRAVDPIPVDSNLQFINIHPNFVPLPLIAHPELTPPPYNTPFLPPGIPVNFVPADPKLMPNFINFVPNHFVPPKQYEQHQNTAHGKLEEIKDQKEQEKPKDESKTENNREHVKEAAEIQEEKKKEEIEKPKSIAYKNDVDIAKIVSKLEEAAKEQKIYENRRNFRSPHKFNKTPRQRYNSPYEKTYQNEYKPDGYKQSFDKRRLRRYEPKPNDVNVENRTKESSISSEEIVQRKDIVVRSKSEEVQTDLQTKTDTQETPLKSDDWKYSPRHQNYKNHASPRKYLSYNNRNPKGRPPEMSYSAPASNYSESLKKSYNKSCPRYEKHTVEKVNATKPITSNKLKELTPDIVRTLSTNRSSQWISVSNRKKRKNKSTNEEEAEAVDDTVSDTLEEVFEAIDVPQVEEILEEKYTAQNEQNVKELSSNKIDSFIEMLTNKESSPLRMCSTIDIPDAVVVLQDVKDIEKELLRESIKVEVETETAIVIPEIKPIESLPPIPPKSSKEMAKKKSKKGNAKNSTKRIMILDPDLSEKEKQKKDKIKTKTETDDTIVKEENTLKTVIEDTMKEPETIEATETIDSKASIENVASPKEEISEDCSLAQFEAGADIASTPDKKKSKKKKKQSKPSLTTSIPSVSSSLTTLNTIEDSYDFLLDTTALVDEKTNIEVSEELDKMIHKGLFGNLEEKFKSLNVSVDDDFFKSLNLKPKVQSTPDKGFIKATNFTTMLNNGNQTLPKAKANEDLTKIDIDFSKITLPDYEPQPSTSKTGVFLEETTSNIESGPTVQSEANLNTKSNGKLKNKSKKGISSPDNENISTFVANEDSNVLKNEETEINPQKNDIILENEYLSKSEEILEENPVQNNELNFENTPKNDIEENAASICKNESENCQNIATINANVDEIVKSNDLLQNEDNEAQNFLCFRLEEAKLDQNICDTIDQASNLIQPEQNTEFILSGVYAASNSIETDQAEEIKTEPPYIHLQMDSDDVKEEILLNNLSEDNFEQNEIEEHIVIKIENGSIDYQLKNGVDKKSEEENITAQQNIVIQIDEQHDDDDKNCSSQLISRNEEYSENSDKSSEDSKPLYPITQAVRDWMIKTRETTPEIEILKSPDTIYKEFIESSQDEDSETDTNQKNCNGNPTHVDYLDQNGSCHDSSCVRVAKTESEDEITVFETWSMSEDTSMQDDLLDCWEPEITEGKQSDTRKRTQSIEEGEDVLEVYESKYGKNEDFLRLKAEIEEQKRNGTFPKHSNLPYRAICCSLM